MIGCIGKHLLFLYAVHLIQGRHFHIDQNRYGNPNTRSKNLIYPEIDQCSKQGDLRLQKDFGDRGGNWSGILNRFLFYTLSFPDSYNEQLLFDAWTSEDPSAHLLLLLPIYWFLIYAITLAASFIIIPCLGAICCFILGTFVFLLANAIKFFGRHLIIKYEKIRRARENLILPRKQRYLRKKFRMPHFFRDYSDEDVPKALVRHLPDDSNSNSEDEEEERLIEEMERTAPKGLLTASQTDLINKRKMLAAVIVSLQGESKHGHADDDLETESETETYETKKLKEQEAERMRMQIAQLKADSTLSATKHVDQEELDTSDYEDNEGPHVNLPLGVKVQSPTGKLKMHIKKKQMISKQPTASQERQGAGASTRQVIGGRPKLAALERERDGNRQTSKLRPDVSQTQTQAGLREMQHEVLSIDNKKQKQEVSVPKPKVPQSTHLTREIEDLITKDHKLRKVHSGNPKERRRSVGSKTSSIKLQQHQSH